MKTGPLLFFSSGGMNPMDDTLNSCLEIAPWEMDTVKRVKNGSTECLLTITERKSRAGIIRKLKDGKAASVIAALDTIERELGNDFSKTFKSITAGSSPVMKHWNAPACLWENYNYYFSPIRIDQRKEAQTKTVTVLYASFFQRELTLPMSLSEKSLKLRGG
jgi:hypothetical protein